MFGNKKPLPWFLIALGMLLFCALVFFVARKFQRSVSKELNSRRHFKLMRKPAMSEELFV